MLRSNKALQARHEHRLRVGLFIHAAEKTKGDREVLFLGSLVMSPFTFLLLSFTNEAGARSISSVSALHLPCSLVAFVSAEISAKDAVSWTAASSFWTRSGLFCSPQSLVMAPALLSLCCASFAAPGRCGALGRPPCAQRGHRPLSRGASAEKSPARGSPAAAPRPPPPAPGPRCPQAVALEPVGSVARLHLGSRGQKVGGPLGSSSRRGAHNGNGHARVVDDFFVLVVQLVAEHL